MLLFCHSLDCILLLLVFVHYCYPCVLNKKNSFEKSTPSVGMEIVTRIFEANWTKSAYCSGNIHSWTLERKRWMKYYSRKRNSCVTYVSSHGAYTCEPLNSFYEWNCRKENGQQALWYRKNSEITFFHEFWDFFCYHRIGFINDELEHCHFSYQLMLWSGK